MEMASKTTIFARLLALTHSQVGDGNDVARNEPHRRPKNIGHNHRDILPKSDHVHSLAQWCPKKSSPFFWSLGKWEDEVIL